MPHLAGIQFDQQTESREDRILSSDTAHKYNCITVYFIMTNNGLLSIGQTGEIFT